MHDTLSFMVALIVWLIWKVVKWGIILTVGLIILRLIWG